MTGTNSVNQERAAVRRIGFRRAPSIRTRAGAARSGSHRGAPAVRRPPRGEVSLRRDLAEFLASVYQTLPSPAALAYLRELDSAEREAALFDYAAHLGERGVVPPVVQRRLNALRQFVASLA